MDLEKIIFIPFPVGKEYFVVHIYRRFAVFSFLFICILARLAYHHHIRMVGDLIFPFRTLKEEGEEEEEE